MDGEVGFNRSEMALNYWMMVERCPNLKEEVSDSIPGCEISSLLDKKTCQVVNCLMCFGIGMSAFCLIKKRKRKKHWVQSRRNLELALKSYDNDTVELVLTVDNSYHVGCLLFAINHNSDSLALHFG